MTDQTKWIKKNPREYPFIQKVLLDSCFLENFSKFAVNYFCRKLHHRYFTGPKHAPEHQIIFMDLTLLHFCTKTIFKAKQVGDLSFRNIVLRNNKVKHLVYTIKAGIFGAPLGGGWFSPYIICEFSVVELWNFTQVLIICSLLFCKTIFFMTLSVKYWRHQTVVTFE